MGNHCGYDKGAREVGLCLELPLSQQGQSNKPLTGFPLLRGGPKAGAGLIGLVEFNSHGFQVPIRSDVAATAGFKHYLDREVGPRRLARSNLHLLEDETAVPRLTHIPIFQALWRFKVEYWADLLEIERPKEHEIAEERPGEEGDKETDNVVQWLAAEWQSVVRILGRIEPDGEWVNDY